MPFSPRPAIAFPASQTPAGLTAQAVREHRSDYAETQGGAQELNRRTDGYWLDLPYSPGRFICLPPSLWIVAKKDVHTGRYKVTGAQLILNVNVLGSVAVAQASPIRIVIPERLIPRYIAVSSVFGSVNGVPTPALAYCSPSTRTVDFYRADFSAWPVGPVEVAGQIVIEVEEL